MVRAPSLYLGGSWFESKRADSEIIHISDWLGVQVPPGVPMSLRIYIRASKLLCLREGLEKVLPYPALFLKSAGWETCTERVAFESLRAFRMSNEPVPKRSDSVILLKMDFLGFVRDFFAEHWMAGEVGVFLNYFLGLGTGGFYHL